MNVDLVYIRRVTAICIAMLLIVGGGHAEPLPHVPNPLLSKLTVPSVTPLEELVTKSNPLEAIEGFASYYSSRFIGKRTTSGHRYQPKKMTAAHNSLPLGTVVRVVNPATKQEVRVTINDRCARKPFPFIDLSHAAAKKIGLWGKGRIKVVIIPLLKELLEEPLQEPA
ncbi:MAG: septal ring lytic transglycosylase RlpA family protein [Pedobacter sp.]